MIAPYLLALLAESLRATAFYKDEERPRWVLAMLAVIWTVATVVCFRIDRALLLTLGVCVLPHVFVPFFTERGKWRIACRLLLLPLVLVPFLLPAEWLPHPWPRWHDVWHWLQSVPSGSHLIAKISLPFVFAHLAGMLLCLSDCNLLLRFLLRLLGITPPSSASATTSGGEQAATQDVAQYLRGGLVGAIERLLVYIFAANAAFNAIAFVITVKGIVRYQEIVKTQSAEWVLIGTLLSTLMAMLLGMTFVRLT